ncbi:MAG: hypothetical protein E7647_02915 [Ruminococcaceae bacterium]|nr:hypothetical protein [Oscillospiraceae bacterium]
MKKESKSFVRAKRLAVSALLSALSFVFMYAGALTGVFDLCAVVAGALFCAFAVIELRGIWPWLVCATTGALSLLLLPDKFVALEYIALGGIYPILKAYFERLPKVPSWAAKLGAFNVMLTLCLILARFVMGIQEEWVAFNALVYLAGNVFFVIFDYSLTVFISYYMNKLRQRMKIKI